MKVLLLLRNGVLIKDGNPDYLELMKQLAQNQYLYIIIASSDYIYGTNYQFCHGVIGKDINNMTQQKIFNRWVVLVEENVSYTVRFRDDEMIKRLFEEQNIT